MYKPPIEIVMKEVFQKMHASLIRMVNALNIIAM